MSKEKAAAATTTVTAAVVADAEELPRTIVRRVVKEKLNEICGDGGDVTLHKEALLALSESARIFIHYLSATAHDVCNESKRQIINADDVLNAFEEIEFSEFVAPLRSSLDEFRKAAGKRAGSAKTKEANKKRKTDEEATAENGKDDATAIEIGNDDETIAENGKDEDDEVNEDEGEDAEQASEDDNDDSHDS